ncbi:MULTISPECIES: hypothetical protein [unclassified Streptomyces]|uniref:hypothetical protein n=1 Tax=unclassified Streptomyces TaxID=2593676 RepID=UPI0035DC51FB
MSPANRRAVRTVLQTIAAVAAVLPALTALVADSADLAAAAPWAVGTALSAGAFAGVVSRVMSSPLFEAALDRVGLGLVDDGSGGAR